MDEGAGWHKGLGFGGLAERECWPNRSRPVGGDLLQPSRRGATGFPQPHTLTINMSQPPTPSPVPVSQTTSGERVGLWDTFRPCGCWLRHAHARTLSNRRFVPLSHYALVRSDLALSHSETSGFTLTITQHPPPQTLPTPRLVFYSRPSTSAARLAGRLAPHPRSPSPAMTRSWTSTS